MLTRRELEAAGASAGGRTGAARDRTGARGHPGEESEVTAENFTCAGLGGDVGICLSRCDSQWFVQNFFVVETRRP